LKTKLLRKNPKWKPSCFNIDDVPQEVWALWRIYSHSIF
jgi:hypothetical protein